MGGTGGSGACRGRWQVLSDQVRALAAVSRPQVFQADWLVASAAYLKFLRHKRQTGTRNFK
jgi:hypothetical protein